MRLILQCFCLMILCGCTTTELIDPPGISIDVEANEIRFAAFGDYGDGSENEAKVADLVKSLNPDFIITLGDNNYPKGKAYTLNEYIGSFFCDYIYNYDAPTDQQCMGKAYEEKLNRFFPSLGNHDYDNVNNRIPYLNYFTLPGNEIYYDFVWGPVHFYCIDSNFDLGPQKKWLADKVSESVQPFNVVYFHHPPYSSGYHGNDIQMQWGFEDVDLVLSGHDHIYQRNNPLINSSPVYVVSGLGGKSKGGCNANPLDANLFDSFCYDDSYGVLIVDASKNEMNLKFISIENDIIDSFTIQK